jgi:integrase
MTTDETIAQLTETIRLQALQIERLTALLTKDEPEKLDLTFRQAVERYYGTVTTVRASQLRSLLRAALASLGDRQVSTLRRADLTNFRAERLTQKTRSGCAPALATVNLETKTCKAVMSYLVREEVLAVDPWQKVKKLPGQHRRETVIDEQAFEAALAGAPLIAKVFLTVAFWTGMRANEVGLIEWGDIDWTANKIFIPRERTKTKKSRWAPMPAKAREALESMPRHPTSPHVFARRSGTKSGKPYTKCRLWQLSRVVLDKLEAATGDGRVHTHDARHSMVSRLASRGVNTFTAMKIVGHSSAAEHWRYHHISDKDLAETRALLDAPAEGSAA